jgi:hypothetical protein
MISRLNSDDGKIARPEDLRCTLVAVAWSYTPTHLFSLSAATWHFALAIVTTIVMHKMQDVVRLLYYPEKQGEHVASKRATKRARSALCLAALQSAHWASDGIGQGGKGEAATHVLPNHAFDTEPKPG